MRILVIAGEDAVNIIQQKTAAAPLVEVRDRGTLSHSILLEDKVGVPPSTAATTFAVTLRPL